MLDIVPIGRVLVLLLVLLPLASAALAPLFGRSARRFAVWAVLLHMAVAAVAVMFASQVVTARRESPAGLLETDTLRFLPEFVPGDSGGPQGVWHRTKWTLLSLSGEPGTGDRPGPHVQFFLGLDGLNMWLVALASLIMLPAVLASWSSVTERRGSYYGLLFLLQAGAIGAFLSFDVVLFYVFFELTLIPGFLLIGRWGSGSGRRDAARKFFLYTLAGSLLTLVGVVGVVVANPTPVHPQTGVPVTSAVVDVAFPDDAAPGGVRGEVALAARGPITFSLPDLMANVQTWADAGRTARRKAEQLQLALGRIAATPGATRQEVQVTEHLLATARRARAEAEETVARALDAQFWLFLALMAGFLVKVPVWPFHTWLPAAYGESPVGVTVLLSALLAKLGTFGILRFVLPLTPDAALAYGLPAIGTLAAFGIVYAALCAYNQKDIKLVIAYSSVSHLGFLVLGLFAFNAEGLSGAVLHMVNHGLSTGALFALLAFLLDRYRTTQTHHFGGLMGRFPNYAVLAFVVVLASIGLPGLNNFVSEMLMIAGLFKPDNPGVHTSGLAVVAVFGILLSAWYMLTMLQRVFFNPPKEPEPADPAKPPRDVNGREFVAFGMLAGLCLFLGLFPQLILDTLRPDVRTLAHIGNAARARAGLEVPPEPSAAPPARQAPPPGGAPKGGPPKGGKGGFPGGGKGKGGFPGGGKGGGKGGFPKGANKALEEE
jgi:NADH-quinone oxidoreductase subunit M